MTVTLTGSAVTISGDVTIQGGGSTSAITGDALSNIITVTASGDAIVQGVRIYGAIVADAVSCGGGIHNDGTLQVSNVLFNNNQVNGQGGAICNAGTADLLDSVTVDANSALVGPGGGVYNAGVMTITNSVISNNSVTGVDNGGDGAGVGNAETGDLTIDYTHITGNTGTAPACGDCSSGSGITSNGTLVVKHSTIDGNHGDNSAAIQAKGSSTIDSSTIANNDYGSITNLKTGAMTIVNSTISGNLAGEYPKSGFGGIHNDGSLSVLRSTIADNTAVGYEYGGFYNSNQSVQTVLLSDLISNNGAKSCSNGGNVVSQGGNVMTDDSCMRIPEDMVVADAKLGPLADNGGPTMTRALLLDSPAIDNGSNHQCVLDQRGATRPVGATCDAGAFESGGSVPGVTPSPSPTPAPAAYPMGDTNCSDTVTSSDVTAELRLVDGLDAPSDCGRTAFPCTNIDGLCYPVWVNPDCNDAIDGMDVLMILSYVAGTPLTADCTAVGVVPGLE
ncbi:MAG: right-handed parallel beta-helix repeat-containing protein [Chloroflexota bacterium]